MRLCSFLSILLFLTFGNCEDSAKLVNTRIHGKWKQTSILAEISEYIANQDETLFWKFLDLINEESDGCLTKYDSQSLYDLGISVASKLLNPSDLGLLRLSLSSRIMSPRVEVHRQLAMKWKPVKCISSFFVYRTQAECKIEDLNLEEFDDRENEIYSFDHIYNSNTSSGRTIFIYGDIGSKDLQKNIEYVKKLSEPFRFVFRHLSNSTEITPVSLSGYGIELALKNTEYKSVDSSSSQHLPENLHGLNFKTLLSHHSNLQKELESFRENLEKLGEIVPLKNWQLKDLGYKTCEKIKNIMEIEEIEELLQDFPIHARAISHKNINGTFLKSVKLFQKILKSSGIEDGKNLLAINGRILSKDDSRIDLFSLIESVKNEKRIVDEIVKAGLGNVENLSKLLTLIDFSPLDISRYALDYRSAKPKYLNNLESMMSMYKSLHLLFQPFHPGQIRPISRNIFNVILFADPFDSDDKLYEKIQEYLKSGIFIRFGIVPIFDEKKHRMSIEKAVESMKIGSKKNVWGTKAKLLDALKRGNEFLIKSGLQLKPIVLLNGYILDISSPEAFDVSLSENVIKQTTLLQISLYHRLIEDSVKIDEWWLKKENNPDIVTRINEKIDTAFNERKFLEFIEESSSKLLKNLRYFSENSEILTKNADVTTWIITDFKSPMNRDFVVKTLKSIAAKKNNKIALISNPSDQEKKCSFNLDEAFSLNELIKVLESDSEADYCTRTDFKFLEKYGVNFTVKRGDTVVISNGLIIKVGEEYLKTEDFEYLDQLWNEKGAERTAKYLNKAFAEDISFQFYSIVSKNYQKDQKRISFDEFKDENEINIITFPPKDPEVPSLTITWICNPVSRESQQLVSIVKLLRNVLNSRVEIIFNPPSEILEIPIKRFYRFVASEELEFNENGSIQNHFATFSNLPQKQLLTMSIETNDGWMIEVKEAEYDLDNILLESASGDVEAVFSLEHILVEGQSYTTSGEPSAGMEIELNLDENTKYDTIVMRNLGYFQLKAEPGVWNLRLRNKSDKYQIVEVDSKKMELSRKIPILVDSFSLKWTTLTVKEIQESEKDDESSIGNLIKNAKDYFSSPEPTEIINVFSLASGHLYERFMRIMIVSVMKNTKAQKVKFWLLKNYLSPKFKESVPILAEFYGFEYELVEYKWPKWLHQQTEKQRVMWGYKILFLDVLFPLNVDKIIFVDADQVVRADLLELMNFNLNGAPYGYVPFCESRKEMDGFRFWKSGYWNTHLMGRRYHISALYVVDLKAFRKLSAGDRLRGRYDSLSSDPNSLSNLDQDLPNNMIHEVPIKSLPQDWLWCETWCSDESKTTAKTIDLCNNPLTKEPKLNSAQRIIGEWKDLDEEISNVIQMNGQLEKHLEKDEL